jgi:hypothetical protein
MTTSEDLEWWLELAPTLPWKYARTMPQYPHSYVIRERELSAEDFDRANRVVRTFGEPAKFFKTTRIYLRHDDDEATPIRWWTMSVDIDDCQTLNQSNDGKDYGEQNAPATQPKSPSAYTAAATHFNSIATWYDRAVDLDRLESARRVIVDHFGAYAPDTLDIGAGTGQFLDLGLTPASFCTVVDPAQAMLNTLVLKHPKIRQVFPGTARMFLERGTMPFELITALGGSAGYLTPEVIGQLPELATRLIVLMFDQLPPPVSIAPAYADALEAARRLANYAVEQHGFITVVIERG